MKYHSKMELFQNKLKNRGYTALMIAEKEISVWYKADANTISAILCIELYSGDNWIRMNLQQIKSEVARIFKYYGEDEKRGMPAFYNKNIEIFTLLWTDQADHLKEYIQDETDCWIIDLTQNRLIVYENQRNDFTALRTTIEDILYETEQMSLGYKNLLNRIPKRVNVVVILVNVLVYLILESIGETNNADFMLDYGAMYPVSIMEYGQWYRIFSSMFMHFGIAHLVNNMVILFFLGNTLETFIGSIKYVIVYLTAGISGGLLSLWYMLKTDDFSVGAGASGAVFGVIGALLFISVRTKGKYKDLSPRRLVFMVCMSLYYGFTAVNVDNMAHIGGLLAGFILGAVLFRNDMSRSY